MKWSLILFFLLLIGCAWPPAPTACGSIPSPEGIPPQGCSNDDTSSLIVDTAHVGFHMTDPQKECVTFDLQGNGNPRCYSWPEHGSGNAWLVYDADGVGVVDSGKELFGNFAPHSNADWTKHPNTKNPSGFLALAWYDQTPQGGDINLIIDKHDQIWAKLRLWIDDHCYLQPDVPCASRPGELHPLEEFGIDSISLVYTGSNRYEDTFKNSFKFSAPVNPDAETEPVNSKGESCCDQHQHSSDGRLIFEVFLQAKH